MAVAVYADRGGERSLETMEGFLNAHEFSYLGYVCGRGYAPGDVLKDERAVKRATEVADTIVRLLRPED
ncbi:hypothetical protein DSECCO2_611600 [anaerobic digester metagenome]